MVESEAKELSEETMLEAVMTGHRGFQPVIDVIIRLAERPPRSRAIWSRPDVAAVAKAVRSRRSRSARSLQEHRKLERYGC